MDTPEVLVVGAGPTGLTLACCLLLHGVSVRVVDRAPGPAVTSRANFLHARGSEVLDRLGALGTLPDESLRALQITTYLGDRPIMKMKFGDPGLRTAAPPMLVSQARIEAALRDRFAELGGVPEWNQPLVDIEEHMDGVTAVLGDGRSVRAQWLVGCDGTGSTTRKLAGIGFPGVKLSERFLLADVHLDWDLDRSGTTGWIHPAGLVAAMPMPDPDGRNNLWRLFAYDPGHDEKPTEQEILERFRQVVPERTGRAVRFGDAEWLSLFTVHRRLADTYRQGRILLAGDAAHAHAPFGGQGMLTGIGDAENLAFKLALVLRDQASEPLIDTYQGERRPLATGVLRHHHGDPDQHREQSDRPVCARSDNRAARRPSADPALGHLHRVAAVGELPQGPAGRTRAQAAAGRSDRRSDLCPRGRRTVAAARRAGRPMGVAGAEPRRGRRRGGDPQMARR